ncbi:MAG: hypothetical protein ACI39R_04975 [Lachnospiraceae bacterium]
MPFIWLVVAFFITNTLRNKYRCGFAQNPGGYIATYITITVILTINPIFFFIVWLIAKKSGIISVKPDNEFKRNNQNRANPYYNSFSNTTSDAYKYSESTKAHAKNVSNPYDLPRRENGRKKIIEKFNEAYNLNLTRQDVQTIVSATYMSIEWASEVYAMNRKYDSLYEWMGQGNVWLRVYLHAFNVQNISPVFNKQEELVFQAFNAIFSEMCVDETLPTEVIISNINSKYLTNFDETSFMLAINYMESKGMRYKYGAPVLTRMSSDIENLARKYEST